MRNKLSFNEVIKRPKSKSNLKLAPGDQIIIGTKPGLVKISGAVNSPGNYQFIKNKRFNDYVKLAGGYTKDASRLASYVVLPNGTSKKIKLLSISPEIADGSNIVVGLKQEYVPFNFTEYFSTLPVISQNIFGSMLIIRATS